MSTSAPGLPVHGYKPQNEAALALVNQNKLLEELVIRQIEKHKALGQDLDQRMVAIAFTQIQDGFMFLNRAVFKPGRVDLDAGTAAGDLVKTVEGLLGSKLGI